MTDSPHFFARAQILLLLLQLVAKKLASPEAKSRSVCARTDLVRYLASGVEFCIVSSACVLLVLFPRLRGSIAAAANERLPVTEDFMHQQISETNM